jgi:CRISPR-associated endonuclease Cas2
MTKSDKSQQVANVIEGVLDFILDTAQLLPLPFETPYMWARRMKRYEPGRISHALTRLRKKGSVRFTTIGSQKFIQLTKKGQMQALLNKSKVMKQKTWDRKWRLIVFDIPEQDHAQRDEFRRLLRKIGFLKLQASVFINPYPISSEAIEYLKISGLIKYIRVMRVDKIDEDKNLVKHFRLKR